MNHLEAQGIAAKKVRSLRGLMEDLEQLLARIQDHDRDLRAVLPLLTLAAKDEIHAELEKLSTRAADAFLRIANPAEDPA